MASKKLQILLTAKENTGPAFKKVQGRMSRLKKSVASLQGAFVALAGAYGVQRLISSWVSLAAVQQEAEAGMLQAMKSMGRYTPELHKRLLDVASGLQEITTYGDEAIIQGQKFLLTYRDITDDMLPRTTSVMTDLAALMGGDMKQAANMLGKASMGMTGELRRVGITVDETAYKTKGYLGVLEQIEQQVKGQATALANTGIGPWKQLANIWGDAKEDLGELILMLSKDWLPILRTWAKEVKNIAEYWTQVITPPDWREHSVARREELSEEIARYQKILNRFDMPSIGRVMDPEVVERYKQKIEGLRRAIININKTLAKKDQPLIPGPKMLPPQVGVEEGLAKFQEQSEAAWKAYQESHKEPWGVDLGRSAGDEETLKAYRVGIADTNRALWQLQNEVDVATAGLKDLSDTGQKVFSHDLKNAVTGWGRDFNRTVTDMMWGADFNFNKIAESFGRMVTRMIVQKTIVEPMLEVGMMALSSIFGFARGNVFEAGRVVPFASGGVVKRPAVFPMARGIGLVGEKGPEAIMPLSRMPGGDLGVKALGAPPGERTLVNNNVQVNIINKSGMPLETKATEARFDGEQYVVDVTVDRYMRSRSYRQMFQR